MLRGFPDTAAKPEQRQPPKDPHAEPHSAELFSPSDGDVQKAPCIFHRKVSRLLLRVLFSGGVAAVRTPQMSPRLTAGGRARSLAKNLRPAPGRRRGGSVPDEKWQPARVTVHSGWFGSFYWAETDRARSTESPTGRRTSGQQRRLLSCSQNNEDFPCFSVKALTCGVFPTVF